MKKPELISARYYLTAKINPEAIRHNCAVIKSLLIKKCRVCVAVKCNAYGHGVKIVVPALSKAEVDMLAVSSIRESEELVSIGWKKPILILGSEFSIYHNQQKKEYAEWIVENDIQLTITSLPDVTILNQAAERQQKTANVHILLDTGMNRMGLDAEKTLELIQSLEKLSHVKLVGLYTHFSTADDADKSFAKSQLEKLKRFAAEINHIGKGVSIIHAANSAAAIDISESHLDMVRLGISAYGYHAGKGMQNRPELRPAMRVVSFLTLVKEIKKGQTVSYGNTWTASQDTMIGIVPIGYGDGYRRALSNKGHMKIAKQFVPVVGRVTMDQTIVDLGPLFRQGIEVKCGDEVVVIDNISESPNSVESLAVLLDTIPYEIVTNLGSRIRRQPC